MRMVQFHNDKMQMFEKQNGIMNGNLSKRKEDEAHDVLLDNEKVLVDIKNGSTVIANVTSPETVRK